jgi:hypothetical protein
MNVIDSALGPAHAQAAAIQLDLVPLIAARMTPKKYRYR